MPDTVQVPAEVAGTHWPCYAEDGSQEQPPTDVRAGLQAVRDLIASDRVAITCQTMGQYRTILLHYVDSWLPNHE